MIECQETGTPTSSNCEMLPDMNALIDFPTLTIEPFEIKSQFNQLQQSCGQSQSDLKIETEVHWLQAISSSPFPMNDTDVDCFTSCLDMGSLEDLVRKASKDREILTTHLLYADDSHKQIKSIRKLL